MQNMPIGIFRGDDTDAFSYQTIVGTINTDLDLTGCRAVFRYLDFSMEFDPIPDDRKLTIVIPADETKKFPPGLGYASLRVYDSEGRLKTFSNRIMVFVATKTPMFGNYEFEVDFNVRTTLEPLKFFVGPNPDDFDEYRGYVGKVIDRASAEKYGLAILLDAIDSDLGAADGVAATPVAVKAAYAAIIDKLTNDYYTADETDEAIDRVAAYYITYDAAGNPFPTYAALANAQTVYSGGQVRTPTRNDYCVVLADETHDNAEYRYIYAVADGETTGSWQPQFPVEGVMTVDPTVTRNSQSPVASSGIWSAIWGALSTLPTGFSSLYDWCVSQLAGKLSLSGGTMDNSAEITWSNQFPGSATYSISRAGIKSRSELPSSNWTKPWADIAETSKTVPTSRTVNGTSLSSDVTLTGADIPVSGTDATKIDAALAGKLDSTSAAPAFSTSSTYAVGEHCTYNGGLYRCTTAVTTAGAWDASKWASDTMTDTIPYDRITITTGQLQDRAVQKVELNAASTTLVLPALTGLSGKVADFGIDMVNAYTPKVDGTPTPTAASFTLAGTIGTDYNLIVPKGDDWSEMTALAAGEMAQFYFTLSSFQLDSKPTWKVVKQVVQKVTIPTVTP